MLVNELTGEVKKALENAKSIFIFLPQNANLDATAASLALFLSLKGSGKNVLIGSPSQMRVEFSRLVGIDKITDKVGNRNLILSFDYKEESIEKVSYNVEGEKFNLVIQPRSGFPPLNQENVKFSYEGIDAQLIFIIGAQKLESLGSLYEKDRQAFTQATVVNIDRSPSNTKFGQINILDSKSGSISELIYSLIKNLSLSVNADTAGNLLRGIEAQTQNFQAPFASVETFETAAELMRAGAKRSLAPQGKGDWRTPGQAPFPQMRRPMVRQQTPLSSPFMGQGLQTGISQSPLTPPGSMQPAGNLQEPTLPPAPIQAPIQNQTVQPARPVQGSQPTQQFSQASDQGKQKSKSQQPPKRSAFQRPAPNKQEPSNQQSKNLAQNDWLKPKIYKGKTKV
jgi:nanoRNase/pAp phosphatase (c-di-AMP/oligoRNAs hydrolase)